MHEPNFHAYNSEMRCEVFLNALKPDPIRQSLMLSVPTSVASEEPHVCRDM